MQEDRDAAHTHRLIASRYRLIKSLGKGSFGEVFQAEDARFEPPRAVAVKLLHPQYVSEAQVREDLKHEASVLARFNHPNILRVIDFGITEELAYIVTDLAVGGSLAQKIRPDPLQPPLQMPLVQVADYLDAIADALDDAHAQGLVHRDIKPQNILLDQRGRPLLADFGLATAVSSSASSLMVETTPSGTPLYMAPEQWQGQAGRASDIYALGAVVYQLITGYPPFLGSQFELMGQHLQSPTPRLVNRAANLVYPAALDDVIGAAMAKDPRVRLKPAQEFARRFREALSAPLSTTETAQTLGIVESASLMAETMELSTPSLQGVATVSKNPPVPLPPLPPAQFEVVVVEDQFEPQPESKQGVIAAIGAVVVLALLLGSVLAYRLLSSDTSAAQFAAASAISRPITVANLAFSTATRNVISTPLNTTLLATATPPILTVTPVESPTNTPPPTSLPTNTPVPATVAIVALPDTPIPPTNTPIPPTNTPIPPTNTPIPTNTLVPPTRTSPPVPTGTPIPTNTPIPPTNTPLPIPTNTPIPPTNTAVPPTRTPPPVPTNTPLPPPTLLPPTLPPPPPTTANCSGTVARGFDTVLRTHPDIARRLGCPNGDEKQATVAYQPFERGLMVFVKDYPFILVLDSAAGKWREYPDAYDVNAPSPTPLPARPDCLKFLASGFREVWVKQADVKAMLGCPLNYEQTNDLAAAQRFSGGLMVFYPAAQNGKRIYTLITADRTYYDFEDNSGY